MRRLRNCNLTTVAPTGTISIIAGCSSGIEPLFAVAFMRNQAGVLMPDVNEDFVRLAKQEGWYSGALMQRIAAAGHIHFDEGPAKWQRVFVTAHDVDRKSTRLNSSHSQISYAVFFLKKKMGTRPQEQAAFRRYQVAARVRARPRCLTH